MLFLIHINDLLKASSNLTTVIFADDMNLFLSRKNIETLFQSMNTELEKTKVWFKANKLSLKTSKTKFYLLHFLKKTIEIPENRPLFMINNIAKKPAKVTKFPGVFLDENISWKPHIDKICSYLSKSIGILYKARKILSKSPLKQLYFSFIDNYLLYVNISLGYTHKHKSHCTAVRKCSSRD